MDKYKVGDVVIGSTGRKADVNDNNLQKNRPLAILKKHMGFVYVCFGSSNSYKARFIVKNKDKEYYFNETTAFWIIEENIKYWKFRMKENVLEKLKECVESKVVKNKEIKNIDEEILKIDCILSVKERKKLLQKQWIK